MSLVARLEIIADRISSPWIGLSDRQKDWVLFCIIALFALLLMPMKSIVTTSDSGKYILEGLRWHKGQPQEFLMRGPGFPMLIALYFHLFSVSVKSAFLVVRSMFVLNALIVYILGCKLFDRRVGFIAALLVLASAGIHKTATGIWLDNVVAFFIVLFYLLFYIAIKKQQYWIYVLSGIVLGFGFLVKEVAIIALPVPILVYIFSKDHRNKHYIVSVALLYTSFLIVVVPWLAYVHIESGSFFTQFIGTRSYIRHVGGSASLPVGVEKGSFVVNAFHNISTYYNNHVKTFSPVIAPLIPISWLFAVRSAVYKRRFKDFYILSIGISIFPILLAVGGSGTRLGQTIMFFLISYVLLAWAVVSTAEFADKKTGAYMNRGMKLTSLSVMLSIGMLGLGVLTVVKMDKVSALVVKVTDKYSFFLDSGFEVQGRHNKYVEEAVKWVTSRQKPGSEIMTDGYIEHASMFYTNLDYRIHYFTGEITKQHHVILNQIKNSQIADDDQVLSIMAYHNFKGGAKLHRLFIIILAQDLLNFFDKSESDIFMVYKREKNLWNTLEFSGWVDLLYKNKDVKVFKIDKEKFRELVRNNSIQTQIGADVRENIEYLKRSYPDEYHAMVTFNEYFNMELI